MASSYVPLSPTGASATVSRKPPASGWLDGIESDRHRGQSLVVRTIREGRQCARVVDEFLMGWLDLAG